MREHRVLIVAGDEPDERVFDFSSLKEVPPYVLYRYEDVKQLKRLNVIHIQPFKFTSPIIFL